MLTGDKNPEQSVFNNRKKFGRKMLYIFLFIIVVIYECEFFLHGKAVFSSMLIGVALAVGIVIVGIFSLGEMIWFLIDRFLIQKRKQKLLEDIQ